MANTIDRGASPRKTRQREGLHLRPLNVEKGAKRFSFTDSVPPRTATWRNNLIALSQRRNLLFVAYGHQIYVWEPAGSFQIIRSNPEMIITPVMKEPYSSGYISPNAPHDINNILVDDLGREEVLLLVTDSGNVCGYRVEAIFSALKRASENNEKRPLDGPQVDPFFVEYVEASAWGLAIHKFARLIAVTANTGLVTVFAFALVNPASGRSGNTSNHPEENYGFTEYGQTWLHIKNDEQFMQLQRLMPDKHRTQNIKLTYTGHFSNIPSVGFYNSDLDPNGTWMVSTDIDNKLLVWKIWEGLGPFQVYHFNDLTFKSFPETVRHEERGWAVLALDPRTFHQLKTTEEACGGRPLRRGRGGQPVFDLTKLSSQIPDASHLYHYFPPAVRPEPGQPLLPDIFKADCRIRGGNGDSHSDDFKKGNNLAEGSGSDAELETEDQQGSDQNASTPSGDGHVHDSGQQNNEIPRQHRQGPLTTAEFLQFAFLEALGGEIPGAEEYFDDTIEYSDIDEDEVTEDEEMDDADSYSPDTHDVLGTEAAAYQIFDPPPGSNFPILHFSQTDIRLIPNPFAPHASVVCGAPLRQPFTRPIVSIRACDRFNMVKYIPEHGIVVAASQKGRAAVIALTESETSGLSFRVDWIVPLESQEKYGDRPLVPLIGMSVSPIQGFEIPPDVSHIPRNVEDDNDLTFHYKYERNDDNDTPFPTPSSQNGSTNHSSDDTNTLVEVSVPDGSGESTPMFNDRHGDIPERRPTIPECHARATRAYQPDEGWRGWNPSRRYRLLLVYDDHTVMSYEFWYDWGTGDTDGDADGYIVV